MNYFDLLKQAFNITWRNRPLWLFGFFLALCSSGSGGGGNSGRSFNVSGNEDLEGVIPPEWASVYPNILIGIGVGILLLVLLLIILGIVVRAVSQTALIGMVDRIIETEAVTIREGWHFGWSVRAWRMFLINVLIGIPLALLVIILFVIALTPLLLLLTGETVPSVIGIVLAGFAVIFLIFFLVLLGYLLTAVFELAWRRMALTEHGVQDSIRGALGLIRRHLKEVGLMMLILFGVAVAWTIVSLIVVLPVALISALLIGGIPALAVYLLSNSGIGAAVAGIPLGFMVLILISSAARGLYLTYLSTVWSLVYYKLLELERPPLETSQPAEIGPDA